MKFKDTCDRNAKTRGGTKRQERRKTGGYAGFQVSITCLSWVAAVTNALIRFLVEFHVAFMCVCARAGGQRGGERI